MDSTGQQVTSSAAANSADVSTQDFADMRGGEYEEQLLRWAGRNDRDEAGKTIDYEDTVNGMREESMRAYDEIYDEGGEDPSQGGPRKDDKGNDGRVEGTSLVLLGEEGEDGGELSDSSLVMSEEGEVSEERGRRRDEGREAADWKRGMGRKVNGQEWDSQGHRLTHSQRRSLDERRSLQQQERKGQARGGQRPWRGAWKGRQGALTGKQGQIQQTQPGGKNAPAGKSGASSRGPKNMWQRVKATTKATVAGAVNWAGKWWRWQKQKPHVQRTAASRNASSSGTRASAGARSSGSSQGWKPANKGGSSINSRGEGSTGQEQLENQRPGGKAPATGWRSWWSAGSRKQQQNPSRKPSINSGMKGGSNAANKQAPPGKTQARMRRWWIADPQRQQQKEVTDAPTPMSQAGRVQVSSGNSALQNKQQGGGEAGKRSLPVRTSSTSAQEASLLESNNRGGAAAMTSVWLPVVEPLSEGNIDDIVAVHNSAR